MDIKQVYESIMAELRIGPGRIADAEKVEAQLVEDAGGWASLGKNEGERGMALVSMMARRNEPTVTETRKRFDSAVAQAGLTSAMLNYLAKDCQETEPQDFDIDTTGADVEAAVNGNGKIEAGLFAELGL